MAIGVGFVGAGRIAQLRHLPEFSVLPSVKMVAVSDIVAEAAQSVANTYGIPRVYTGDKGWRELLEDSSVDAVVISTPNRLHAPVAIAAAKAGKHVLVEKPMAMSLAEADEMIEAAKANNVVLMVAHNQRFMKLHREAKTILESGFLGKVYAVKATFGHPGPEVGTSQGKWFFQKAYSGGGCWLDLGIHKVDLVLWMVRRPVIAVSCFMSTLEKDGDVEDNALALLQFDNGTLATINVSWTLHPAEDSLVVHCERGSLWANSGKNTLQVYTTKPVTLRSECEVPPQGLNRAGVANSGVAEEFIRCLENGDPPPVSGEEARAALAVILAGYEVAEARYEVAAAGRVVRLN